MRQLTFEFLKETVLRWEDLDETARVKLVEKLARVIAKAVLPDREKGENEND